ncbi:response regulator [Phenylobacterium sp. LjRoot219]|uniref:ATP-binding protein n=1 Tax=Phenylobacterium sp. LjRoot219 TaxID=3342283 RepID=UPI003ECD6FA6
MRLSLPGQARSTLDAWAHRLPRSLAIALDLIPADPEDAAIIRGAQVHAIVRVSPYVMAASCFNGIVVLATFAALGALRPVLWVWALLLFAMALRFSRAWWGRTDIARRSVSRRTVRRAILNGAAFGALWGAVPAVTYPGAPVQIQLFVACVTSGMMSAGAFVLAAVPLAGMAYVAMVAAGALYALALDGSPASAGIIALLASYLLVIVVALNWTAALLVNSLLAEAQIRREVAAREQAQAQSAHAERMTALGQLAGGIAHDFNNILQVVSGGAARIDRDPGNREGVVRDAQRIQDAVERGSAISRRLLAFARRDALNHEAVDAAALLTDVGDLLAHTIGPSINVHIDVARTPGRCMADRRQLETVILNLATNARDAMPKGGDLTVSAAGMVLDHDCEHPRLKAGAYVRIAVADTGTGIGAETLSRVAEPFFTTKPKGKGTGLGLSMAKGFAEQSGGAFAIASELGRGTTVTLWLPQADANLAPPPTDSTRESAAAVGRRVLMVDDDELVREMLMASLEDAGFVILEAEDAANALALLDQGAEVDALLTDFSMPGMDGLDLIREVHARKPDLPAILLTGHVGEVAAQAVHRQRSDRFTLLQKPMKPAQIAERLAALIA